MTPTIIVWSFLSGCVGGVVGHLATEWLYAWWVARQARRIERYRRRAFRESIPKKPYYDWNPTPFDGMGSVDE